jgi:Tol biopolymer transport system component
MLNAARLYNITIALSLALTACQSAGTVGAQKEREYTAFGNPERITIRGYSGHAMEPFVTRDGRYLFFNNSNDPSVNTNLHYAERINDLAFEYKGEVAGVNTQALEGVPTMDKNGAFYFVSTRSYRETLSTIYQGRFSNGAVTGVKIVEGISEKAPGRVNFDVEVSADGRTFYFVDGVFSGKPTPDKADIAIAVRGDAGFRRLSGSAELLKNVNTDDLEYAACISPDELELFFTRVGKNGPAIYRSTRKNVTQPFDPPERVAAIRGFVEAPALSPDGRSLYYHLKEGERFVIYRVSRSL